MKKPSEWYSRRHMGLVAAVLLIIGTWTAIVLLPTIFLALALFVLIGGLGLFIAYKQKSILKIVAVTSLAPAWFYFMFGTTHYWSVGACFLALFYDSAKILLVVTIVSVALAFVWSAWKARATNNRVLTLVKRPILFIFFALVIVAPFFIGGLHDYNVRADESPRELVSMEIVAKWSKRDDEGNEVPWWMTAVTPDGDLYVDFRASYSFYDEHDIGSFCQIIMRKGALRYPWMEGYVH